MSASELLCCEPCKYRGITSSAVKYCESCQEQLCKECVGFHRSFKVTRDHLLVSTADKHSPKLCLNLENLRMCQQHVNKTTEFYCCIHDTLICSLCLLKCEQHRNCIDEIIEISNVGQSLSGSKFTESARGEFQKIIVCAHRIVNEMKDAKDAASRSVEAIKYEADALRSKFIEVFDRQIQKIVKKAVKIKNDNNDKYTKTIENQQKIIKEAEDNEKILETILESASHEDVFRCLISVLKQMEDFKIETEKIIKGNYKQEIVIMIKSDVMKQLETHEKPLIDFHVKSSNLGFRSSFPIEGIRDKLKTQITAFRTATDKNSHVDLIRNIKEYKTETGSEPAVIYKCSCTKETMTEENQQTAAELDIAETFRMSDIIRHSSDEAVEQKTNTQRQTKCQQEIVEEYEIELKHSYTFSASSPDGKIPWFGGIACLPNERLLLSDFNTSRLILLDDDNRVLLTKNLKYEPGNISLINAKCLAVFLMKTNQILLIDISNQVLREKKYLQTKYHPKCVQPVDDKLLVSSQDGKGEWYLHLMTLKGSICRKIKHERMFDGYKLAIQNISNETEDFRIVHCCEITNNVQCFGSYGSFVFDYGVERGASVVTDSNGYIFVIRYTGEVQVLSPNGHYLLKLYSKSMSKTRFAAFNQAMDKLFITTYKDPKIHVLNVKRTIGQ